MATLCERQDNRWQDNRWEYKAPAVGMGDSAVSGRTADVLQMMILGLICMMAFMIRLFAVVRYESVIHEFDPYFNYRTTDFLVREGPDAFRNWCDGCIDVNMLMSTASTAMPLACPRLSLPMPLIRRKLMKISLDLASSGLTTKHGTH
eukprot:SAG31_NODE_225_length_19846_cov_19.057983_23_plen_148_part_00